MSWKGNTIALFTGAICAFGVAAAALLPTAAVAADEAKPAETTVDDGVSSGGGDGFTDDSGDGPAEVSGDGGGDGGGPGKTVGEPEAD